MNDFHNMRYWKMQKVAKKCHDYGIDKRDYTNQKKDGVHFIVHERIKEKLALLVSESGASVF